MERAEQLTGRVDVLALPAGEPAREIVQVAETGRFDLVILGRGRRSRRLGALAVDVDYVLRPRPLLGLPGVVDRHSPGARPGEACRSARRTIKDADWPIAKEREYSYEQNNQPVGVRHRAGDHSGGGCRGDTGGGWCGEPGVVRHAGHFVCIGP